MLWEKAESFSDQFYPAEGKINIYSQLQIIKDIKAITDSRYCFVLFLDTVKYVAYQTNSR